MKRGPLGFGDEPGAGGSEGPRDEEPVWLPGPAAGEPDGPRRARARLPGLVLITACFVLLVVAGLNTLRTEGVPSTGPSGGSQIPPFAAPLVLSDVEGDVNLARERDQGAAGSTPACDVRRAGVITSCALVRERPAVIAFFAPGQERCVRQLDVLSRALAGNLTVAGLAVSVRGNRGELRALARERRWNLQVAQDRDGGLANVYGVAVCPQYTFVLPGGRVLESAVGDLDRRALELHLSRLVSRARELRERPGSGAAGAPDAPADG